MSILREVLGPASKYDHRLPYTYEARVVVAGVPGMTESYICDTLCGLLERLARENVGPDEVTILEIRPEGEFPVLVGHCLAADGSWLRRPEACRMFETHYAGHEKSGRCCYRDRNRKADGPFVGFEPPVASGKYAFEGPAGESRRKRRSVTSRPFLPTPTATAGAIAPRRRPVGGRSLAPFGRRDAGSAACS